MRFGLDLRPGPYRARFFLEPVRENTAVNGAGALVCAGDWRMACRIHSILFCLRLFLYSVRRTPLFSVYCTSMSRQLEEMYAAEWARILETIGLYLNCRDEQRPMTNAPDHAVSGRHQARSINDAQRSSRIALGNRCPTSLRSGESEMEGRGGTSVIGLYGRRVQTLCMRPGDGGPVALNLSTFPSGLLHSLHSLHSSAV